MDTTYAWRGDVTSAELNALHAEAFQTRLFDDAEWNWLEQLGNHSLGWVTARAEPTGELVGFVNVISDGLVHAWLQDTMVAAHARHTGIGKRVVSIAVEEARRSGCEWMHVDFADALRPFYLDACGFEETSAGLIAL
jgi:GNAT superfamily N-acetyltransferase